MDGPPGTPEPHLRRKPVKRRAIPLYVVTHMERPEKGNVLIIEVIGDDPDGGCRTAMEGDIVGAVDKNPPQLWEVAAINYPHRRLFLQPFRHELPDALNWKPVGFQMTIVSRGWETPVLRERRRYADKLAEVALNRLPH